MSGHLLCRDTFSMYGRFYHVNVPLMRTGYFGFLSQLRQTVFIIFVIFFLEIFYFKNGDGQTAWCVVGKTMFYHGYKAVGCGPRLSAAVVNAKSACLNLLKIALTILKKQVNNVNDNERVSTCCLFDAAADINR